MRALRRLLFALAGLALAGPAFAHAGLISADPPAGSIVADEPAAVTLNFTEPVAPIGFSLIGVGGTPQVLGFDPLGPQVVVTLPPGLARGSYLLSWRVTSADGHPVNGTVDFAIGAATGTVTAEAGPAWLDPAIWLVRALHYVALFLGVGSLAFGLLADLPSRLRRTARFLAVGGLVLAPVALALQGLDLTGGGLDALATVAPWQAALATPYAPTLGGLAAAFLLTLLPWRRAVLLGAVLGALAPVLSGHVVTAAPQGLMRLALALHLLSLMFWLGALLPLFVLLRQNDVVVLSRFSRLIPWGIACLLGSGLLMAAAQLGPPGADWLSGYGVLLGVKLALVAIVLLLALWNRVSLTARAANGDVLPLRRSILAELALVLVVFGVVAGWRFTPPPRVLAEIAAAQAPITASLSGDVAGTLTLTPGRPGSVTLDLALPVAAQAVTVHMSNPAHQVAAISKPAMLTESGGWRIGGLLLPVGGAWQVAVDARTGDFDLKKLGGTIVLPETTETDMHKTIAAAAIASSMLATPALAATDCPYGQSFTAHDVTVSGAYIRATVKGAQVGGAYLSIANAGSDPDTLTGASSDAAKDITLHQMSMNGNVMEMAAVEGGLAVPAGGSVSLDPMGYHLMLTGMAHQFLEGQCVSMVLHFARAGDIPIELNVGKVNQDGPPGAPMEDMPGMEMSGMSSM